MPAKFEKHGSRNGSMLIRLLDDFRYISSYGVIKVPKGFVGDGASIPRPFWSIFSPFNGDYFEAALVHDYLYSKASDVDYPTINRAEADEIFKEAMYNLGVGWLSRGTIYSAVRLGGWASYKKK
jgi:hypothetical protein